MCVIMINILYKSKTIKYAAFLLASFFCCSLLCEPIWFDDSRFYDQFISEEIRKAPQSEIDMVNVNGYTGLMIAAKNGTVNEAKDFLARNASASATATKNFNGNTPLHLAILGADDAKTTPGNIEIVKILLDAGVPLFARNQRGEAPLHEILFLINNKNEKMELADILIAAGAQVNLQDSFGNTMLHNAVQQNDVEFILAFRKKYNDFIDPTIKNNKKQTLYEEAQELHFADDLDAVGASLNYPIPRLGDGPQGALNRDDQDRTALMFALYRGNIDEAKKYIDKGADINARDRNGFAPIHYAMLSPRPVESLKTILEKSPNVNVAENTYGNTPLLMIAQIEHAADRQLALRLLMSKGADINAKNKKGQTLLDRINQQAKLGFKDTGIIRAINGYLKK